MSSSSQWWVDDLKDVCVQFQLDLSCLVDGELDEVAAGRAIAHLEECCSCKDFFEDTRQQVQAHRDLSNPEGLLERYASLLGAEIETQVETIELVHRLSTIFYQLGKAYVLNAVDPGFRVRVFEKAVPVDSVQAQGRGFIDGVVESGRGMTAGLDWTDARHMLNGKLEKIESALEKGRRLLDEALRADPTHEEARIYLSFLHEHEGKKLKAAKAYRQIFRTAVDEANRAFAALRLGKLYAEEGEFKQAIACNRWITISGLADDDDRFFFARFNIGMYYADLGQPERSLAAFRTLLDRHPQRTTEIADLFLQSDRTRETIDRQGFTQALFETCPELFEVPAEACDSASGDEEDDLA